MCQLNVKKLLTIEIALGKLSRAEMKSRTKVEKTKMVHQKGQPVLGCLFGPRADLHLQLPEARLSALPIAPACPSGRAPLCAEPKLQLFSKIRLFAKHKLNADALNYVKKQGVLSVLIAERNLPIGR